MLLTRKNRPALVLALASLLCLATAIPSVAQDSHGADHARDHHGPPMDHSFHGSHGRWWNNPHLAQKIGLTDAQKQQMDQIFEKHRPQLKELNATLKKEEASLHPLLQADKLDEHKVFHQIDAIAQARANLEKANARMLFGLRKVLTPDQWKKLQAVAHEWHMRNHRDRDRHDSDGPRSPHHHDQPESDQSAPPSSQTPQ